MLCSTVLGAVQLRWVKFFWLFPYSHDPLIRLSFVFLRGDPLTLSLLADSTVRPVHSCSSTAVSDLSSHYPLTLLEAYLGALRLSPFQLTQFFDDGIFCRFTNFSRTSKFRYSLTKKLRLLGNSPDPHTGAWLWTLLAAPLGTPFR